MSLDYDPKVIQPEFLCEWCHDLHDGDCADDKEDENESPEQDERMGR